MGHVARDWSAHDDVPNQACNAVTLPLGHAASDEDHSVVGKIFAGEVFEQSSGSRSDACPRRASLTQSKVNLASSAGSAETATVINSLHHICDWLLENFNARRTPRAEEVEALDNAKAVHAGANYHLGGNDYRKSCCRFYYFAN